MNGLLGSTVALLGLLTLSIAGNAEACSVEKLVGNRQNAERVDSNFECLIQRINDLEGKIEQTKKAKHSIRILDEDDDERPDNYFEKIIRIDEPALLLVSASGRSERWTDPPEGKPAGNRTLIYVLRPNEDPLPDETNACSGDRNFINPATRFTFQSASSCIKILQPGAYKLRVNRGESRNSDKRPNVRLRVQYAVIAAELD